MKAEDYFITDDDASKTEEPKVKAVHKGPSAEREHEMFEKKVAVKITRFRVAKNKWQAKESAKGHEEYYEIELEGFTTKLQKILKDVGIINKNDEDDEDLSLTSKQMRADSRKGRKTKTKEPLQEGGAPSSSEEMFSLDRRSGKGKSPSLMKNILNLFGGKKSKTKDEDNSKKTKDKENSKKSKDGKQEEKPTDTPSTSGVKKEITTGHGSEKAVDSSEKEGKKNEEDRKDVKKIGRKKCKDKEGRKKQNQDGQVYKYPINGCQCAKNLVQNQFQCACTLGLLPEGNQVQTKPTETITEEKQKIEENSKATDNSKTKEASKREKEKAKTKEISKTKKEKAKTKETEEIQNKEIEKPVVVKKPVSKSKNFSDDFSLKSKPSEDRHKSFDDDEDDNSEISLMMKNKNGHKLTAAQKHQQEKKEKEHRDQKAVRFREKKE